jgi:hypothetical protein
VAVVPAHRRIIAIGKYLSPAEQGPVRWSGFDLYHPEAKAGIVTARLLFAFWYWVPSENRCGWKGKSRVPDLTAQETAMLRTGELEEVRRNVVLPACSMAQAGTWLLRAVWEPECIRRLGEIPEVFRGRNPLSQAPSARALEQERGRIVVGD